MAHNAGEAVIGARAWAPAGDWLTRIGAPLLALSYPFVLLAYRAAIDGALRAADGGAGWWIAALAGLVAAYGVPLLALVLALRLAAAAAAPAPRRVALLAVAAPPLLNLLGPFHGPLPELGVWGVFWAVLAGVAFAGARGAAPAVFRPAAGASVARRVHITAIIGIGIAIFLLFHVVNQLSGLAGAGTYDRVMKLGRVIYRSAWIEPILLTLIFLQLLSGLYLLWRDSVGTQDRLRTLQIATGGYLIFFLLSHLNATLLFGRQVLHGDTGFAFATGGPDGLLRAERLIPYYGLAVFFALLHVALGLRRALLARRVRKERADRLVTVVAVGGAVLALVIIAGLCRASLPFA
ncbi:MAG: hypothetical protein IT480_15085 [Gammaproteobacteria bacterium]|nr:hypothetical protein [Gammaproteobacteria bacterium]